MSLRSRLFSPDALLAAAALRDDKHIVQGARGEHVRRIQRALNLLDSAGVSEDGVYGLGDATLNGRELAVASYLRDHVVPLLIGRDARQIDILQRLRPGTYWKTLSRRIQEPVRIP